MNTTSKISFNPENLNNCVSDPYFIEVVSNMRKKLETKKILPLRAQGELWTEILQDKIENVLPKLMKKSGIDFWIVICREYFEDPVFKTLSTWDAPRARRMTVLSFYLDESTGKLDKHIIGISTPTMDKLYKNVLQKGEDANDCIKRLIKELNPKKIGVNISKDFGLCDGLSHTLYDNLLTNLGDEFKDRIVSSEDLCVMWLEHVTEKEKDVLKTLVEVTHDIINASYNSNFIIKGKTTTADTEWFMRECVSAINMDFWFGPDVDLQRNGAKEHRNFDEIIKSGDFVHCDIGLTCKFIPLNTDVQRVCYILKEDETDAPEGIKTLLSIGNRLQDIVNSHLKEELTGNDVFLNALNQAKEEGINAKIYTHPLGTYGHGAGALIGLYDKQEFIPGRGERIIAKNTAFALELNINKNISVWENDTVYCYLEEDIYFDGEVSYLSGRQTDLICV